MEEYQSTRFAKIGIIASIHQQIIGENRTILLSNRQIILIISLLSTKYTHTRPHKSSIQPIQKSIRKVPKSTSPNLCTQVDQL